MIHFFKSKQPNNQFNGLRTNHRRTSSAKRPSRNETSKMIMSLLGDQHFLKEVKKSTKNINQNFDIKSEERVTPMEKVEVKVHEIVKNISKPKFEKSVTMQTRLANSRRKKDIKDSIKRCTIYTRESMIK
mmetsp:Transcript_12898/g.11423  ORF Transcript_12898/g.11423 Transcript_12898/m.11423 type:complete len:130 (+) Transcript_12898:81-470(+)